MKHKRRRSFKYPSTLPDLFKHTLKKGDCMEWQRCKNATGYGVVACAYKKKMLAHRLAWSLANGKPPPLCVLHKCDNPACINPDHLVGGTQRDNVLDMVIKGRAHFERRKWATGNNAGPSKLTPQQVSQMRALRRTSRTSYRKLAAMFGVTYSSARMVCLNRTYKESEMKAA